MPKLEDITGQKFHRWTVKEYVGNSHWLCVCECGTEKEIFKQNLRRGMSKSCGCLKTEMHELQKATPKSWTSEKQKEYMKIWKEKNADKLKERTKAYRESNKEKLSERKRRCYEAKKHEYRARVMKNYYENPEPAIRRERQKATLKKEATPAWADLEKIKELYLYAQFLSETTGVPYEVDHIIPLKNKLVCGLHCEQNMQVITMEENRRKRNHLLEEFR